MEDAQTRKVALVVSAHAWGTTVRGLWTTASIIACRSFQNTQLRGVMVVGAGGMLCAMGMNAPTSAADRRRGVAHNCLPSMHASATLRWIRGSNGKQLQVSREGSTSVQRELLCYSGDSSNFELCVCFCNFRPSDINAIPQYLQPRSNVTAPLINH